MTRILVLYDQPEEPSAFDEYYFETHVPIAKKMPGLRSFVVSSGAPGLIAGKRPPYLIAELEFDDMEAVQAAMASEEGQATAGDLAKFAQAGVTVLTFDVRGV